MTIWTPSLEKHSGPRYLAIAEAIAGDIRAGRLRIARQLEPWTAVLISINKRYKTRSGTFISGLPSPATDTTEQDGGG